MSRYALDRHKRAARAVGYALTADDPVIWNGVGAVLAVRLTDLELARLAYLALAALDSDAPEAVFVAAQWGEA